MDGALIDSAPHFVTILNAMLEDRGAVSRLTDADSRAHATAGGLAMIEGLLRGACGPAETALAEFRARYAELPTPPDCLFPGVREALDALRTEGVILAVWSNKSRVLCEKIVADLGLADRFAATIGTGPDVPLKPDSTGLDLALAGCGSSRAHACFVGDSEVDHAAAERAGVPFVLLTHGYGDYAREFPGAVKVASFAEIPAAVLACFERAGTLA